MVHRWAGPTLIAMSLVHLGMSFVLFPDAFASMARAGLFGGASWAFSDMEMLAAFWFLTFTWPALALGFAVTLAWRQHQRIAGARTIGWLLIFGVIASGFALPVSGLWAFAIPGAMLAFGR